MIEPVRVPTRTDSPRRTASRMAIRNESRGAPTSEAMAMRFAPTAMAIAPLSVPKSKPATNTASTGRAVMAPATGLTSEVSTCKALRSAVRWVPRDTSWADAMPSPSSVTCARLCHENTLVFVPASYQLVRSGASVQFKFGSGRTVFFRIICAFVGTSGVTFQKSFVTCG